MRHIRTEGIVIKRINYGESDRIVTVLTRDYGKLSIKATGVRKITSRRSSHIELLNHVAIELYKANAIPVLTEAKIIEDFAPIKMDFEKVGLAYHICEIIDGLCPDNQENRRVFSLLRNFLTKLATSENAFETVSFEKQSVEDRQQQIAISDYTLGTYGIGVNTTSSRPQVTQRVVSRTQDDFEKELLRELGYSTEEHFYKTNTHDMIESIMERRLKSHKIFAKLQ